MTMTRKQPISDDPPTSAHMREAALRHLARYAVTRVGLLRVLDRRIRRWAASVPEKADPAVIAELRKLALDQVNRLIAEGLLDDATYAERRARALREAGHSRVMTVAYLTRRGIDPATCRAALTNDPSTEIVAALVLARRRRLGPFRIAGPEPKRELGALARAGFPEAIARRVIAMPLDEAERCLLDLRRA